MPDPRDLEPLLIPRPRSVTLTGGRVHIGRGAVQSTRDGSLEPQGYRLTISADPAAPIKAWIGRDAGPFLAATLNQLRAQYGDELPRLTIEDAPAFSTRGVMLDISRDRIPAMDHFREVIGALAALKFNHLQLYTEHTFAYRGHETVWRGWDPVTPEEARTLDGWCRDAGIELAANQNCFGHLASWLRHENYAPLAETHGEWTFEYNGERFARRGPFSLCPTDPRSLALVEDLLGQLLPSFTSPLVNIGCDETYDIGSGRSAAAVRERGREAVCAEFIGQVCQIARRRGKRPQFWADMVIKAPALMSRLGPDATALIWDYEPGCPWGERVRAVRDARLDAWVCPGTSSWRSITGRTRERRANLAEAAAQGLAAGATGFLVTDWGDSGHHQQWPIALHALAEAADAAWTGGRDGYDPRAAALHIFGDRTLSISGWLDALGDADEPLRRIAGRAPPRSHAPDAGSAAAPVPLRNSSALFLDLHTPLDAPADADARTRAGILSTPASEWQDALDRLHALDADAAGRASPAHAEALRHTLDIATFAAERALWRRGALDTTPGVVAARLETLLADHRRLWLTNSRPGGLDSSCRHYQRIIDDLRSSAR
jgi:hypothetical protein